MLEQRRKEGRKRRRQAGKCLSCRSVIFSFIIKDIFFSLYN